MQKIVFFLGIWLMGSPLVRGQEIQINESPDITQLYKTWVNFNRSHAKITGWRVQIMASPDRTQVEAARNRFRQQYPEVKADWVHEKPYYKLKAGAFRTRLEALAFMSSLLDYPGAFPVKDSNIHPRDFLE
jgi:hypothetical protein